MKTLIFIIIFSLPFASARKHISINQTFTPTIEINSNLITVMSSFEHKEVKWSVINKDFLKTDTILYYVLEENFSAQLIITKYRQ